MVSGNTSGDCIHSGPLGNRYLGGIRCIIPVKDNGGGGGDTEPSEYNANLTSKKVMGERKQDRARRTTNCNGEITNSWSTQHSASEQD